MDINKLIQNTLPALSNMNDTETGQANDTTHGLLESLMPLLGGQYNPLVKALMPLYNMMGISLGFDPSIILTVFGVIWAGNKLFRQIYTLVYGLVTTYLMANVHITSNDDTYSHMMKFLASQPTMVNSRSLTAESFPKSGWEETMDEDMESDSPVIGPDGAGITLNFSSQEAKSPLRFTPALGTHGFWFEGRFYGLHRKQESLYDEGQFGAPQFRDREKLTISCFGRSPEPIKKLLQHAKEQYYKDHQAKTIIKRPSPPNMRRYGGRHSWIQVASRPVRPMATVVLDEQQKINLLTDMNEYLHPASPIFHAFRGIPLRKGYLFHGPPGCGKTSLSFALAGVFGLEIYVISLLEPSLTEEDLSGLFNSLPRRCVVLLEDIDTAGLARAPDVPVGGIEGGEGKESSASQAKDDWKVADLARALKKHGDSNDKKGISLSGLLNAIDGVASQEGRVLIMTTNMPESLDEALIRPGRVDLQVSFTNATQEQARELFERMMSLQNSGARSPQKKKGPAANAGTEKAAFEACAITDTSAPLLNSSICQGGVEKQKRAEDERVGMSHAELVQLAADFAVKIPSGQFSPAEIQGFLLKRKKFPRRAVTETDTWVQAMLKQKASKTKVLLVQ